MATQLVPVLNTLAVGLFGTVGVCSDPIDFSLFTNALNLEFV